MVATVIDFPGNINSVASVAALRNLPSANIDDNDLYEVRSLGFYTYDVGSLAVDNGSSVLKPNDLSPLQSGRWLFGPRGTPGASDNTYDDLTAFKASDTVRLTASLVGVSSVPDGRFNWTLGNFTGQSDDLNIIKADSAALTLGAWVRQKADGIQIARASGSTSVEAVLLERVTTSGYGTTRAALQAAIDSGAREVIVNNDITVSSDVTLRPNQTLRFAGGKLIVQSTATITNAVLNNSGGTRIVIIDPVIDASVVTGGVPGIKLFNVSDARIDGGKLKRCNLLLDSTDNTVPRTIRVNNLVIDMDGYASTATYISGTLGVAIQGMECFGGAEGIGVYNNARQVSLNAVRSHHHTRDGFVVISGQQVDHTDCRGYSNGQSGFTTQRQSAAENTRFIGYKDCHADNNAFDGFDIRGANDDHAPWDRDICVSLSGCSAAGNVGCGFYVVRAQGTKLVNCTGRLNGQQNLLVDTSDRVTFQNFQSLSGATAIASGINKAGVTIYNSNMVSGSLVSGNWETEQQSYGLSITGASTGCRITGGDLSNNSIGPFILPLGNAMSGVSGADTAGGTGYFLEAITSQGAYRESGFGEPTHYRPKGSMVTRSDGGGEAYVSNAVTVGVGSWYKLAAAA